MARVSEPIPVTSRLEVLQPVLEAAGQVTPEDRPDAAALSTLFLRATAQLDPPAALPLAGAIVLPDTAVEIDRDPTMLPEPAEPGASVFPEAEGPAVVDPTPGRRARRRNRRAAARAARDEAGGRRRGRVAVLAVVGLVLVAAGAVAAYLVVFPEHEVPQLAEQRVSAIDDLVGDLGFDVQLVGDRRTGLPAGTVLAQDPAAGEMLREGQTLTVTVNRGPEFVAVPADLTNGTVEQARQSLEAANLRVGFVSEKFNELVVAGTVQAIPAAFAEVPRNSAVDLVVSLGPRPRTIPQDAVGRPYDDLAAELGELSLEVVRVEEPTLDQAEGTVTRIEPGPGTTVPRDSTVTVYVAVAQIEVPDVSGLDVADAADELAAAGLSVSGVQGSPLRDVTGTDPAAGTFVAPGTSVTILTRPTG